MSLRLTKDEAKLSHETIMDIERRHPARSFDRNNRDAHEFVMCEYVVYPTTVLTQPGVTEGWRK